MQHCSYDQTSISAVSALHSSDWLHALPIFACDLHLSKEVIRATVNLRLDVDFCISYDCPCGKMAEVPVIMVTCVIWPLVKWLIITRSIM